MPEPVTPRSFRDGLPFAPIRMRRRVFSASRGQARHRRASDILLLVLSGLGLAALIVAHPPSGSERSFDAFLRSIPGWLDPVWEVLSDLLAVWTIALLVAVLVGRRLDVALHALASAAVAVGVSVVSFRLTLERWPDGDYVLLDVDPSTFPVLKIAVCAAVILAVSPHLVLPLQRMSRWIVAIGLVGVVLAERAAAGAGVAAFLAAVVAATAVRYLFGTSAGYPEPDDVIASLAELGVPMRSLEPAARQPAGVFVARGEDADGGPILVKVHGRDAYDTQLLEKAWRTLWYRGDGPRVRLSRLQAAEHEALLTLLAGQAGVVTPHVVVAGETAGGDALLVMRDPSRPIGELPPAEVDDALLGAAWKALLTLGDARIAHLRIDPGTVVATEDGVGFVDFDAATAAGRRDDILTDRAQMLATTAAVAGTDRAVRAAAAALGAGGVANLLPFLQVAAFDANLRRWLRTAEIDTDDLRAAAAAAVGADEPELLKLRRITWWTLIQLALLVFAVSTIIGALSGLDFAELRSYVQQAEWTWLIAAFVVAQLPRLTQAISTLGSVAVRLPYVPVYVMQLATAYINIALPSQLARMAVNIRFFQRQGIPPVAAVTAGAIDSFTSTVIQAVLLGGLLILSEASLNLGLDTPSGASVRSLLILVVVLAVVALGVLLVGRVRRAIAGRVREWWPEVRNAIAGLRGSNKLGLLIGGSLATEILFATALGVFARAFGFDVGLADLLVINISASLLASVIPVPGGIGVVEFALTAGLVSAGIPEEAALTVAVLYRLATFYLPSVWGFVAFRWLQRNALL